jgi:hypothetical protein
MGRAFLLFLGVLIIIISCENDLSSTVDTEITELCRPMIPDSLQLDLLYNFEIHDSIGHYIIDNRKKPIENLSLLREYIEYAVTIIDKVPNQCNFIQIEWVTEVFENQSYKIHKDMALLDGAKDILDNPDYSSVISSLIKQREYVELNRYDSLYHIYHKEFQSLGSENFFQLLKGSCNGTNDEKTLAANWGMLLISYYTDVGYTRAGFDLGNELMSNCGLGEYSAESLRTEFGAPSWERAKVE